jgi:hypothetical protein
MSKSQGLFWIESQYFTERSFCAILALSAMSANDSLALSVVLASIQNTPQNLVLVSVVVVTPCCVISLLLTVVLRELATELSFARSSKTVDHKPFLHVDFLWWDRSHVRMFQVFQVDSPPRECAAYRLWNHEVIG